MYDTSTMSKVSELFSDGGLSHSETIKYDRHLGHERVKSLPNTKYFTAERYTHLNPANVVPAI